MKNTRVLEPPRCKTLFISLHSFLLVFFEFFFYLSLSSSVPFLLVFLNFLDLSHRKTFPLEHRNVRGSSSSPHNSLGIFCWGRSLKVQREIKREVFFFLLSGSLSSLWPASFGLFACLPGLWSLPPLFPFLSLSWVLSFYKVWQGFII